MHMFVLLESILETTDYMYKHISKITLKYRQIRPNGKQTTFYQLLKSVNCNLDSNKKTLDSNKIIIKKKQTTPEPSSYSGVHLRRVLISREYAYKE
jgi:hypothetical protein